MSLHNSISRIIWESFWLNVGLYYIPSADTYSTHKICVWSCVYRLMCIQVHMCLGVCVYKFTCVSAHEYKVTCTQVHVEARGHISSGVLFFIFTFACFSVCDSLSLARSSLISSLRDLPSASPVLQACHRD